MAAGFAAAYGAEIEVDVRDVFSVLENAPEQAAAAAEVAAELLGSENVDANATPRMGSEDFADMTMRVPGAYVWLGAGPGAGCTTPPIISRIRSSRSAAPFSRGWWSAAPPRERDGLDRTAGPVGHFPQRRTRGDAMSADMRESRASLILLGISVAAVLIFGALTLLTQIG